MEAGWHRVMSSWQPCLSQDRSGEWLLTKREKGALEVGDTSGTPECSQWRRLPDGFVIPVQRVHAHDRGNTSKPSQDECYSTRPISTPTDPQCIFFTWIDEVQHQCVSACPHVLLELRRWRARPSASVQSRT